MYNEYFESEYGLFLVEASDSFLTKVAIVEKKDEELPKGNNITAECVTQLAEYFNLERTTFDLPLYFGESFSHKVLKALYEGKYGETLSYKELGERIDSRAYQAIGSAMKNNPLPIIIPCHRVIKNDGSLGNYYYGPKMKKALLLQEYRYIFKEALQHERVFSEAEITSIKNHPVLNKMFKKMPIVTTYHQFNDVFSCLVAQVIYQQVAFKTALNQETMLAVLCDFDLSREKLSKIEDKKLIEIGLNGPRLKYIRNLVNHDFDYQKLYEMDDQEVYQELIKIKGIGSWTIEMTMLFALDSKRIISYKDLIIINGIKHLYGLEQLSLQDFNEIVKDFAGFETIVSMNLWAYIEQGYYLNEDSR